jgi:hypothetical protein
VERRVEVTRAENKEEERPDDDGKCEGPNRISDPAK